MERNQALKIITPCLGIIIAFQVLSGMAMDFIGVNLPNFIYALHAAGDWLTLFFGLIFIMYHWQWIKTNYFS